MRITPEILEAAYNYLKATPPVISWKLPDPDDIEFHVARTKTWYGWCDPSEEGGYIIKISEKLVSTTPTLIRVMAHEMIHVKQYITKIKRHHNDQFRRDWAKIARYHGFDPKEI
jgi:hypothetical protein